MSCHQVESVDRDTDVVPFTYNLNGFDIQFGREEFCLITGLRFGVEYSSCYLVGRIPFRRRVFESDVDGNHITCRMLLQKIESEEFDTLNDDDAVGVCLLALLQMVLLGREPRHNVPDWYLRNAKVKWWDVLYATQNEPDSHLPKYSLTGFTWAFKGRLNFLDVRSFNLEQLLGVPLKSFIGLTVLMALEEAHDEESCLEEQMLNLMHRFADRFTRRRPEINMPKSLPDHSLIDYGRYALERITWANMRNAASLKMARDELMRSMEEKQEFINNYKEM
ncbi:transposase, MuDR, MULE transposase domain protein [Tanacetum coccineum]